MTIGMKNDTKWLANYEALKAYIDEHHHLPPKNAPLGAYARLSRKGRVMSGRRRCLRG